MLTPETQTAILSLILLAVLATGLYVTFRNHRW